MKAKFRQREMEQQELKNDIGCVGIADVKKLRRIKKKAPRNDPFSTFWINQVVNKKFVTICEF